MRKAIFAAVAIAAGSLLAACSSGGGGGTSLTGTTWYLTAGTETVPAWQWAVPAGEQALYTITFNTDGNFSSKADCNQVGGPYKTSGTDGITITPTVSTMAFCGEDSLDTLFVHALGNTTNYKIENGQLTLTQKNGTLTFTSTKPTASPRRRHRRPSPAGLRRARAHRQGVAADRCHREGARVPGRRADDQQANYTIVATTDRPRRGRLQQPLRGGRDRRPGCPSGLLTSSPAR